MWRVRLTTTATVGQSFVAGLVLGSFLLALAAALSLVLP